MEARFNPVQKSGHIPTFQVGHAGAVLVCFNPVQKSGHIPTSEFPRLGDLPQVLTPFKSPVISQPKTLKIFLNLAVSFNPVQKSGHIPTRKLWIEPIDYGQF